MRNVVARRAGRVAFGLVLIAGTSVLATSSMHEGPDRVPAWQIICGTWVAAFVVGLAVALVGALLPASREGDTLRVPALAVPAVGMALLLPITIQMPFVISQGVGVFDRWCTVSVFATGHTHIVFAVLVFVRARRFARMRPPLRIRTIYLITCVAGAIPFVVPLPFVAATGIPLIPLLARMERIADRDRAASPGVPFAIARSA